MADDKKDLTEIPANQLTTGTIVEKQKTLVKQKITRKKDLYILLPYIKGGTETSFMRAVKFKKQRLKALHPDAVFLIKPFTTLDEFKLAWQHIYRLTTAENANYKLMEIHYFGHSGHSALYFMGGSMTLGMETQLEKLAFNPTGALVLHSCLSARYEEEPDKNKRETEKNSIAKSLSLHLQTKVIGQMVKATNTTGSTLHDLKYRNWSSTNTLLIDVIESDNIALWGYKAGSSVEKYKDTEEYNMLSKYQIWPARGYDKGLQLPRVIHPDYFNTMDLTYI